MSLKDKLRKVPVVFSVLSFVKNKIYLPVKRGYVAYYINYLFTKRSAEVKLLKQKGFSKIKAFAPMTWKIGKSRDKACRHYYRAVYEGTPCFIKVGKNDSTIKNEAIIYSGMLENTPDFVAKPLCIDETFAQNTVMVANLYIDGMRSIAKMSSAEDFALLCRSFNEVLDRLSLLGIVHADIHKGNIMFAANGRLVLLDFGISILKGAEPVIDYLARPGTFFRNSEDGKTRVYDDAYSFVKMTETLGISEEWKNVTAYSQIEERIGKNEVTVNLIKD